MNYEEIWKKATKEVARERDCLNDKLNQAYEDGYQMEGKYRDMKTQRDTLIDDIAVLKANISRLERENELLMKERDYYNGRYKTVHANEVEARKDKNEFMKQKCLLEKENKALRLQSNTYFDEWQSVKKELKDYQDDYEMVTNNCIYWEDTAHWIDEEHGKLYELLKDFSKFINYKLIVSPASDTYKHYRSELDKLGVK